MRRRAESSRAGNPNARTEKQGRRAKDSKVMRRYCDDYDEFVENALNGGL
ncbi:hypothetical protein [Streptomyces chartreusis]